MAIEIVTRAGKGSQINATEFDFNFLNLAAAIENLTYGHNHDGENSRVVSGGGGGGGEIIVAGAGLSKVDSTLNVNVTAGIEINSDYLRLSAQGDGIAGGAGSVLSANIDTNAGLKFDTSSPKKIQLSANATAFTFSSGVLTPTFGSFAGQFCEGNDSRLSDPRTPTSHTHAGTDITSAVANATTAVNVNGGTVLASAADRGFETNVSGGISTYGNELNAGALGGTGTLYLGHRRTSGIYLMDSKASVSGYGDIRSKAQIRATGWYNTTGASLTGLGVEIGNPDGEGYITCYDRDASTYGILNLSATNIHLEPQGGYVYVDGSLGIGTATPTAALQIGVLSTSGADIILSGTATVNDYKITTKTSNDLEINVNSGTWRYLNLVNSNASYGLGLTTKGNVGIGTTTPGSKLEVYGDAGFININHPTNTSYGGLNITEAGVVKGQVQSIGTAHATVTRRGFLELSGIGGISFWPDAVNQLVTITTAGNVGIGTTSFGTAKLNVNGNIGMAGISGVSYVYFPDTGTHTGSLVLQAGFGSAAAGGGLTLYGANHATNPGSVVVGLSNNSSAKFRVNTAGTDGGTDLFAVLETGNVGVGTTTPGAKLHVFQNYSGGAVKGLLVDASVSGGAFPLDVGYNDGTHHSLMVINDSGNVGIGTTSPYKQLTVSTTSGITGIGAAERIRIADLSQAVGNRAELGFSQYDANYYPDIVLGKITTDTASFCKSDFYIGIKASTSNVAPTEYFRITSAGNVGIGTTAPAGKFDVQNTNTAVDRAINAVINHAAAGSKYGMVLDVLGASTSNYGLYVTASGATNNYGIYSAATNNYFSGNVGIGTTAPGAKLHVVGGDVKMGLNGYGTSDAPTISGATIERQMTIFSAANSPAISLEFYSTGYGLDIWAGTTGLAPIYFDQRSNDAIIFRTKTNSAPAEAMRITGAGNVGIGTTAPGVKLEVAGAIRGGPYSASTTNTGEAYIGRGSDRSLGASTIQLGGASGQFFEIVDRAWTRVLFKVWDSGGTSLGSAYSGTDPGINNMIISGYVSIGTTSPNYPLTINGATHGLRFGNLVTTGVANFVGNWPGAAYWGLGNNGSTHTVQLAQVDGLANGTFSLSHDTIFSVDGTIHAYNNLGVGIVSPSAFIHSYGTTEQLRLGYDASNYASFTVGAGGNLTIAPTGDLIFDPTGNDILPATGYDLNIGTLAKKYLTLHAAELWVETLVAQDTLATIGGRILVGPSTTLTSDLTDSATTIYVKHNNLANGDRVYMEANGSVEWMAITSAPGGSGPYSYTVTRNLDGSGANSWYAGDAIFNTGTTGDGFIDLYSIDSVKSASHYGPTIVGNVRNSGTYNDFTEAWAIGNLNGIYGYGVDTYGAAFGKYSAANYMTVDPTNGIRFFDADDVLRAQLTSSTFTIGYTSDNHISISAGHVYMKHGSTVFTDLAAGVLTLGDTSNEHIKVSTSGLELKDGSTVYGQFAATTTIGVTSGNHVSISSGHVYLKNGSTAYTDLAAGVLTLGDTSNEYIKVSTSGFQIYDGATLLATYAASTTFYDTGGADRLVLGTSGITIGDSTEGEYITVDSTNGLRIYGGATLVGQWTNVGVAYVGDQSNEHIKLSSSGLEVKDGSTVYAQFAATTTIGNVSGGEYVSISSSGIAMYGNAAQRVNIASDGSGWLANTNITWDTAGNATIASWSIDSEKIYRYGTGTIISGLSGYIGMNKANSGSGHFYSGDQKLMGFSMGTNTPGTAYALVMGQMMQDGTTVRSNYFGFQMMDHLGNEFFALGFNGANGNAYNRIAGWSFTSTAISSTNISITSGAANTANITVGTGSTAAGLNSANASGDIAIWSGDTFANRASAPFRVTAGGALTATSATITGVVTANTGYIGGTNGWVIAAGKMTSTGIGLATATGDATYAFWAGDNTPANAEFSVTHAGAMKATSATITGVITANTGYIGGTNGWVIAAGKMTSSGIGIATATGDATYAFWAGDNTPANAEFSVTHAGALKTKSATIGAWTVNSTSIYTGTEDHSGYTANAGDLTLYSDGSDASIHANNFYIDTTGTLHAQNANISGVISSSYVHSASMYTQGSHLTASCSGGASTIYVYNTDNFASSGTAYILDSSNDKDTFTYTGKTSTSLTGCSGILEHTVSSTNCPLVIPAAASICISSTTNELRVYGDGGFGAYGELVTLGVTPVESLILPYDDAIATFGSLSTKIASIYAKTGNGDGIVSLHYTPWDGRTGYGSALRLALLSAVIDGATADTITNSWNIASRGTTDYDDSGTVEHLYAERIQYGFNENGDGTTTDAFGLSIEPQHKAGTITNSKALYLPAASTGGTVTNYWAIYQNDANAKNFFAGNIGIGSGKTSPSIALDINGTINATAIQIGGIATQQVLQVQCYSDAGSSTTSTSRTNLNGTAFSFTPKSTSSTLILMFSFYGGIAPLASTNVYAYFDISEGATQRSQQYALGAASGGGGVGSIAPCFIQIKLANTSTSARSFSLYGNTNSASAATSGIRIEATIIEVAA